MIEACAVSHDTAHHLAGAGDFYGDRADLLARDIAADSDQLTELLAKSGALRGEIARIALAAIPDRFGAVVDAIKEHAAAELEQMLRDGDDAVLDDEAEARAV